MQKKVLRRFKKQKTNIFLVFLVLSLLFSVLTKLSKDYTSTVRFEADLENLPIDKVIIDDSTHYFDVTLKTYGFKLLSYYLTKPKLKIDISQLTDSEEAYVWNREDHYANLINQFEQNVSVESVNPERITFNYDQNSSKKIPVLFEGSVDFEEGFNSVNGVKLKPDSITIVGPNSLIDTIHFINTAEYLKEDVNASITSKIALNQTFSSDQIKLSQSLVSIEIGVDKFTEGEVSVPITVINIPSDKKITFFPKEVNVKFLVRLQDFKSITSDDFSIVCDYSGILESTSFFTPKITKKPEAIKNERLTTKRVEFVISQ